MNDSAIVKGFKFFQLRFFFAYMRFICCFRFLLRTLWKLTCFRDQRQLQVKWRVVLKALYEIFNKILLKLVYCSSVCVFFYQGLKYRNPQYRTLIHLNHTSLSGISVKHREATALSAQPLSILSTLLDTFFPGEWKLFKPYSTDEISSFSSCTVYFMPSSIYCKWSWCPHSLTMELLPTMEFLPFNPQRTSKHRVH